MSLISVIIPSHNHAPFIQQAVDSVLSQSVSDLELIIVDDGSTDRSIEILASISDPRIQLIQQENLGAHSAINRGLNQATGEYLAILNSDDFYHPKRLEKTIAVLEKNVNVGLVGSHIQIIDARNRKLGVKHGYQDCEPWLLEFPEHSFRMDSDLRAALLTENFLSTTSNFVFSRRWYKKVGEFRPLRFTHDWDFALRMAMIADLSLLPEPLVNYRVHETNTIREDQVAMIFEICWCLAMHLPTFVADTRFFEKVPLETRIEQILHSIYVYGCEPTLSVMLLQRFPENPTLALRLLEPENPVRKKYLSFISQKLVSQVDIDTPNNSNIDHLSSTIIHKTRNLRTWLRRVSK